MGKDTAIAWTDHTFNPWWGCVKVAPECSNCYAETFAKRTGHGGTWGATGDRRTFGEKHWREPEAWNVAAIEAGTRRRVFCGSMCDVFEDRSDLDSHRARLWSLIQITPSLDWLLLTKRPQNIARMLPPGWGAGWSNVWLGTSAGTQETADRAIHALLSVDAAVRFVSAEPLLSLTLLDSTDRIDWVIAGGESGAHARPMDPNWARALMAWTRLHGAAFFMKQLGGTRDKRDRLQDFPADLRVREFPEVRR